MGLDMDTDQNHTKPWFCLVLLNMNGGLGFPIFGRDTTPTEANYSKASPSVQCVSDSTIYQPAFPRLYDDCYRSIWWLLHGCYKVVLSIIPSDHPFIELYSLWGRSLHEHQRWPSMQICLSREDQRHIDLFQIKCMIKQSHYTYYVYVYVYV